MTDEYDESCVKIEQNQCLNENNRKLSAAFIQSNGLHLHSRKQSWEELYKCEVCLEKYNQTAHLKVHSIIHSEERPCNSKVCLATFNDICNLKVHSTIHR